MKTKKAVAVTVIVVSLMSTAGCMTYDSAVPASTGVGAGAGALLGYGLTGSGTGAAAGAGAGMLAGAITGLVIDENRQQQEANPYGYQSPPQQYQPAPQSYATQADPTTGEFLNNTRWRIEIYIDDWRDPVGLSSTQSYPLNLDIGEHRIVARAYVLTQFGERLVGNYEESIYIDPRGSGWRLMFDETMFQ